MIPHSILHKWLVLTLCFGRDIGQNNHHITEYRPRVYTAVFAIPAISIGVSTILEVIASTTAALLAAKAAHDWHEIHRLESKLEELESELEEAASDEDIDEQDESKTVEDILEDAELEEEKGSLRQYGKGGGFTQAQEDFESLGLKDIKRIGAVKVGILPDGSKVIVRENSREGRPTLEIQKAGSNRVIKIRYN